MASACGLSGLAVLLHLEGPAGVITYTAGAAPSAIWRGQVLMRCGPAFGLHGEPSSGQAQNRVVLDGLSNKPSPWGGCNALLRSDGKELAGSFQQGFSACLDSSGRLLGLRLEQELGTGSQQQRISQERLLGRLP